MKKFILTALLFLFIPQLVSADEFFTVTPALINEKAKTRDIIQETITLTNVNGPPRATIYTFVNNVDMVEGEQEFKARDEIILADSLANWIEISRGSIELLRGETIEVPVTINVNLRAKPGIYNAVISFSRGSTRAQAEERIDFGSNILVTIEVVEDVRERLQLGTFSTNRIFLGGPDISFAYNLENIGNKDLLPTGEVRIYDRRGREVGSVPANIEGTVIAPESVGQIASVWSAGKSFGKYKALLDIEYGSSQLGTVNDTIYFWIVPWKQLLVIFLILATLVGGGTYYFWERHEKKRQFAYVGSKPRRYRKFNEDSLLVPQHLDQNGSPKPLSKDHLLNLRS